MPQLAFTVLQFEVGFLGDVNSHKVYQNKNDDGGLANLDNNRSATERTQDTRLLETPSRKRPFDQEIPSRRHLLDCSIVLISLYPCRARCRKASCCSKSQAVSAISVRKELTVSDHESD